MVHLHAYPTPRSKYFAWLLLACLGNGVYAQHYSAIHGSSFSGSLGVYNNPAVIVNAPYRWDLTLFGLQYQSISNAVKGPNFPFSLSLDATYNMANGNYVRMADLVSDIRLLNGRYSLNERHAFAFGLNIRACMQAGTSTVNYTDLVTNPGRFLSLNEPNRTLALNMTSGAWMELYGSYGQTILDGETGRLNGGVTVKVTRGMSGTFARAGNVVIGHRTEDDEVIYSMTGGNARYGFSSNHGDGSSFEIADLMNGSDMGVAFDAGIQYLVKTQAVTSVYDAPDENEYEWKIGLSLLDIGSSRFAYSRESREVGSLKDGVSGMVLQEKFMHVTDMHSFNDSLRTIVDESTALGGDFEIMHPARAVLNVDRYLSGNWYINGQLTVNLAGSSKRMTLREPDLITVTPRWENRKWGVFLPVQYTRHSNFWIGGALKAGPLLLGTHNLLNIFSKNAYLGSGAYMAIILHPSTMLSEKKDKRYDCPPY